MKCLIQYVSQASLVIDNAIVASMDIGYVVLVGFGNTDRHTNLVSMADKLINCRCIPDDRGKINRSIKDIQKGILLVPQFTLYANTTKGNRPSFERAAAPPHASTLFDDFVSLIKDSSLQIQTGVFGTHMNITLTSLGPLTFLLEN
jgi:D-aminoacyl-tRNA deacylase